jgi:cysteine desulfurase/selenocysteine lyase
VTSFDPKRVRADIPLLKRKVNGRPITYLDTASTSLTPRAVIESMDRYYELRHANVHRGVYQTAEEATATYEGARVAVGGFVGAEHPSEEVVFTKNTTESMNLLAKSWGRRHLREGDVVLLTEMEHHANIVPWFQLRDELGLHVRFIPVDDEFRLDLTNLPQLLDGARLVSLTAMSNVLGTITPVAEIARVAHDAGALVAVDGAQIVLHHGIDVVASGVDFMAFSAHKMLGPTGIGALYARRELLETMPPFLGGGGMIADVSLDGFTPARDVSRFEAGTPPIAESAGFTAAVRYVEQLGVPAIAEHEVRLTEYALDLIEARLSGSVRVIGPATTKDRGGVISLDVAGVHAHDVAQVLDQFGVCVRPGHHCAKPLMRRFDLVATARASLGPYSLPVDVDVLVEALEHAVRLFA